MGSTLAMRALHFAVPAAAVAALLLVPVAALARAGAVSWGPLDFLAAGAISFAVLFGVSAAATARRLGLRTRVVAAVTVVGLAVLAWAELAVGVFGPGEHGGS